MRELEQKINNALESKVPCGDRPIMLNHVLMYLHKIVGSLIDGDGEIVLKTSYFNEFNPTGVFWNMDSIYLKDQSDEVKEFLMGLD